MQQKRLSLFKIDMKYVRELAKVDDNVMSVSPQAHKENRPFVGVILICDNKQYCVPLSSPKEKHKNMNNDIDFTKINDGNKLLAVLNFNNMIPVDTSVIQPLNIKISNNDTPKDRHYKTMATKQLQWCQKNQDAIINKANKLYRMVTTGKANNLLSRRCCDFAKLEKVLNKYISKSQNIERQAPLSRGKIKANAQKLSQKSKANPTKKKEHDL